MFAGVDPGASVDPGAGVDPGAHVEPVAGVEPVTGVEPVAGEDGVSRPPGINTFELHFGQAIRVPPRPAGSLSFVPHFGHWIVLTELAPEPSAKTLSSVALRSPYPTDRDATPLDTRNAGIDPLAKYTHPYASDLV